MKRKQFLRDIVLGIAATILPRILQPAVPEVVIAKEKLVFLKTKKKPKGVPINVESLGDVVVYTKAVYDNPRLSRYYADELWKYQIP